MANNADAAKRTVNGSTTVLPRSVKRVQRLRDRAEAASGSDGDARPTDTTSTDDRDQADKKVSARTLTTVPDDEERPGKRAEAQEQPDKPAEAEDTTDDDDDESGSRARGASRGIRFALVVGLVAVLALGGLAGWFGYGTYQTYQADKLRNLFLAVGKQGALNLTTVNYTEADADIQRILDSSTGQFYDDFSKRAPAFVDVVKQAQAKTDGSIVEAGLEWVNGDSARVLVAVLVRTSNKGAADEQPRHWRMRIDVQKVGETVKVANVGFVP